MNKPEDHLDVDAMRDLKDIMEDEFGTLIDTFISDSQSKLVQLTQAIQEKDAESMRKLAHSLKGSSSNVCALPLSGVAQKLETMGKDGTMEGAEDWLEKLNVEFEIVINILRNKI